MLQCDFLIIFQLLQHPLFYFFAQFLVFNLIFISFAYCFSHPFDVYLNNVLFTLQSSIECDIQFHFLTRYNMTSPFYSNSFNFLFFIFFSPFPLCIDLVFFLLFDCFGIRFVILLFNWECWYMFCYVIFVLAVWYIFCYFIYVVGVLVYVLLFDCFGIGFVIPFPLMDLSQDSQHAILSMSCSPFARFRRSFPLVSLVPLTYSLPSLHVLFASCALPFPFQFAY